MAKAATFAKYSAGDTTSSSANSQGRFPTQHSAIISLEDRTYLTQPQLLSLASFSDQNQGVASASDRARERNLGEQAALQEMARIADRLKRI